MVWLIFAIIVVACLLSLNFRLVLFNLHNVLYYAPIDLCNYIFHREKDKCPYGFLNIYTGLFGKGKTLSAVHEVTRLYNIYNGKKVWCDERKKLVTQKVHIISNVALSIPYVHLESLLQVVDTGNAMHDIDIENDTLTFIIVLIDELSVQLNSRDFKKNINAYFLNALLCCRHFNMGFIGTAQRFGHVDALMRQVTQRVIECDKLWRLQRQYVFDAYELENVANVLDVKPLYKTGFFVSNKDYANYDTKAVVGQLVKSWESGDMLTDKEILDLQNINQVNVETNEKKSLFGRRKRKRK